MPEEFNGNEPNPPESKVEDRNRIENYQINFFPGNNYPLSIKKKI